MSSTLTVPVTGVLAIRTASADSDTSALQIEVQTQLGPRVLEMSRSVAVELSAKLVTHLQAHKSR